jgi:gluconolactonase
MISTISLLACAVIPATLAQQLLQPLPAGYPATPEVVYINNNLAVIPPPFNYTGFLLNGPFTTLNVSDAAFSAELKQASNATFIAFDPRFFDVIGTTPKVELMYNLTGILYEAPAFLPDQNVLFFSEPGSYNQFYVNLTTNPPALTNISFNPPVYAVNGARYSARDKRLYVTSMGGNGTAASIWSADPVTLESVTLANNYRGLHLNSPDDIVVSNDTGLVYFTDPTYAYV